jgi:hypothetical protein
MFRQHTPRMQPHIHLPERLLFWLGVGALVIVVALIAVQYARTPPVAAPEPAAAPRLAVSNPYDGSAYVPYLLRPAPLPWSLKYGSRFNPGTGTVYDGKSYGRVTMPAALDAAQQGVMGYVRAHQQRAPVIHPNVPIRGTGSAYDGQ